MKQHLTNWVTKLAAAKNAAKEAREISGDADLAAVVSEKLLRAGMKEVDRGAINHWMNGIRQPNVPQFIALCEALKVSPAEILGGTPSKVIGFHAREPEPAPWGALNPKLEQIITDIRQADPETQRVALAVAKAALDKSPISSKTKKAS